MVELLIGTALTAVLMVGVMYTVRGLAADGGGSAERLADQAPLDAALQTLAWDLANTQLLRVDRSDTGSVLTLAGLGALGRGATGSEKSRPRPAEPVLAPAVVTYRVVEAGGHALLIRRQRDLPNADVSGGRSALVLAAVTGFRAAATRARPPQPQPAPRRGGAGRPARGAQADEPSAATRALAAAAGLPPARGPWVVTLRLAVRGQAPRVVRFLAGAGS